MIAFLQCAVCLDSGTEGRCFSLMDEVDRAAAVICHGAPIQVCAVQSRDSGSAVAIRHFNKSKATGLPIVSIGYDVDTLDTAIGSERRVQFVLCGLEVEAPYELALTRQRLEAMRVL